MRRFVFVAVLVALDLWSKSAVFAWLDANPRPDDLVLDQQGHARYEIFGDWFAFMISRNAGVAFGQLDSFPALIVGGRSIAVLFLGWLVLRTGLGQRGLVTALVLILSGAIGNLHDNLLLKEPGYDFGRVRDFIDVYFVFWDKHFPTFNVADACISVGAVFLFASSFVSAKSEPGAEPDPAAASPANDEA